jgi:N-acyl homoserine lactone hydrolase
LERIWNIKVLYYGQISFPKAAITPGFDPDLTITMPTLGFLLSNGATNILVDSGISERFIVDGKAWGGDPAKGGTEYVLKALAMEKVAPEDISTVLYTHLHNDHAASSFLFKDARIICQRDEWENLIDPLPVQNLRGDFDPALVGELRACRKLVKVDGDCDIAPGVTILKTPGHSKGSQSIAVETYKGTVVLVGDHYHLQCMAFPKSTELMDMEGNVHAITPAPDVYGPAIPSSLVYDYFAYYDSVAKIAAVASRYEPGYIICGHEPSLLVIGI